MTLRFAPTVRNSAERTLRPVIEQGTKTVAGMPNVTTTAQVRALVAEVGGDRPGTTGRRDGARGAVVDGGHCRFRCRRSAHDRLRAPARPAAGGGQLAHRAP